MSDLTKLSADELMRTYHSRIEGGEMNQEHEWEDALRRAFVRDRADFIYVESRRERFQLESINYGVEKGWLTTKFQGPDVQSQVLVARLTPEGERHFGLVAASKGEK